MPPSGGSAPAVAKPKGSLIARAKAAFRKPIAIDMRLYADYNHSGKVEETDANYNLRGTYPGAILYHASLPSKKSLGSFKTMGEETKIVSSQHMALATSLKLVHIKGLQKDDEVFLGMDASEKEKVMLFGENKVGATAILGKGLAAEAKVKVPTAAGSSIELAMTAVVPFSKAKDSVQLHLTVKRKGKEVFKDTCLFAIAPWLMPHSLTNVEEVYVIKVDKDRSGDDGEWANTTFRSELSAALPGSVALEVMVPGNSSGTKAKNGNRWMQDIVEFGYSAAPGRAPISAFINSANSENRPGFPGVWLDILGKNHGAMRQPQGGGSLDSFGNLEVTPPLAKYPLGKKYHGFVDPAISMGHITPAGKKADIVPGVKAFLDANIHQPVTKIPTNWLAVGHVDEFISIVPDALSGGFKILWASPRKALEILNVLSKDGLSDNLICDGIPTGILPDYDPADYKLKIKDFLDPSNDILHVNTRIEELIVEIIKGLMSDWGLKDTDFIPIPTIFNGVIEKGVRSGNKITGGALENCIARTAGMVNCLVFGPPANKLIMPKPFGPKDKTGKDAFAENTQNTLRSKCGLSVSFVDDWIPYHILMGEIHCGTNVKRSPPGFFSDWWRPDLEVNGIKVNA